MANTQSKAIEQFIKDHAVEIAAIRTELATNYDAPAQRIINAGFNRMGEDRFHGNDDLWEMIVAHQDGEVYDRPPVHLQRRWASY